jgi:hypothetical protein
VFQSRNGEPAVQLYGPRASLLWGYRPVAGLTHWRIIKGPQAWTLTATLERASVWECQQAARYQELLFTAPRAKGRWCFPVNDFSATQTQLRATVGPPEQ